MLWSRLKNETVLKFIERRKCQQFHLASHHTFFSVPLSTRSSARFQHHHHHSVSPSLHCYNPRNPCSLLPCYLLKRLHFSPSQCEWQSKLLSVAWVKIGMRKKGIFNSNFMIRSMRSGNGREEVEWGESVLPQRREPRTVWKVARRSIRAARSKIFKHYSSVKRKIFVKSLLIDFFLYWKEARERDVDIGWNGMIQKILEGGGKRRKSAFCVSRSIYSQKVHDDGVWESAEDLFSRL